MAITFSAVDDWVSLGSPFVSGTPEATILSIRCALDSSQIDSARIFEAGLSRMQLKSGGLLYEATRTSGANFVITLSNAVLPWDGTYRTITLLRASTPGGDHKLFADGADYSSSLSIANGSGTFRTLAASDLTLGNRPDRLRGLAGGIASIQVWHGLYDENIAEGLSRGNHPSFVPQAPILSADFGAGTPRIYSGQSVLANANAGYVAGTGSYRIWPAQPIVQAATGASPISVTADNLVTGIFALGQPSLSQIHAASANNLTTGSPFLGEPALTQDQNLGANGLVASVSTLGTPAVTQIQGISVDGLSSETFTLGQPVVTQAQSITASGITSETLTLGQPVISQTQSLAADSLTTSTFALDQPSIAQIQSISADALTSATFTLGGPAVGEEGQISADSLTTAPLSLGQPAITQSQALIADGLAAPSFALGQPALTQNQALNAESLTLATFGLGSPVLTVADGTISVDSLTTATFSLGQPTVTEIHALSANGLTAETFSMGLASIGVPLPVAVAIQADFIADLISLPQIVSIQDLPKFVTINSKPLFVTVKGVPNDIEIILAADEAGVFLTDEAGVRLRYA